LTRKTPRGIINRAGFFSLTVLCGRCGPVKYDPEQAIDKNVLWPGSDIKFYGEAGILSHSTFCQSIILNSLSRRCADGFAYKWANSIMATIQ